MLRLATQLNLRLLALVAVSFLTATAVLWKGETVRARNDVETLLKINYRDVSTGFTDRADYQLISIAREIAGRLGSSGRLSSEEVDSICADQEIAEIYDVDTRGIVVAGSRIIGADMSRGRQSSAFLKLLEPGAPDAMSQAEMPRSSDGRIFKYAAARFPDGSGYLEVGWTKERFDRYLRQRALGYTRSWHIDERGYIVFVDRDGVITSHADMSLAGKTLPEATGLDPATVPTGTLFRATIGGEEMFCYAGPVRDYLAVLADPVDDAFASRDRFMPRMAAVLLFVFAALFAFISLMLRNRVSKSVLHVGDALRRIAGGDLEGRVDVRSCREFAELSSHINTTVDALRAASEERVRRLEAELELARTIQGAALPRPLPGNASFALAAAMQPAREVGGDFYDYFMLDTGHIAFLVADVSGKGITGALYMMTAKTLIKETLVAVRDPAAALTRANAELCANNPANMFLTAWVGVLDLESGTVTYANAGHNPPVKVGNRRPRGEGRETGEPEDGGRREAAFVPEKSGPALAFLDGVAYKARPVALAPGDALFLYTDGVTEALDPAGALFGDDRLVETLSVVPSTDPESICRTVRAVVAAFAAGAPAADDLTVLAVKFVSRLQRFVRTFPPTQEGIGAASAFLDEVAGKFTDLLPRLHVILDEVASNIVKHSGASGFEIDIEPATAPDCVKLVFIDDGMAYDPLGHEDPDTTIPAAERPIGGLGILMVRKMSDSIHYGRAHNRNFLTVVVAAREK